MNRAIVYRVASLDDPDGLAEVAALVRDWEPSLELYRPPRHSLLYEPDGTLYAVALSDAMTLATDRRAVALKKGDAVVVPRAFAVDAGPDVDLLALRHDGPPPDHFRERFIQVWGFEHAPAPLPARSRHGVVEVIAAADVRHRVPYALYDVAEAGGNVALDISEVLLLVGLEGALQCIFETSDGEARLDLPSGGLIGLAPVGRCRLAGQGRVGVLTVRSELTHQGRRRDAGTSAGSPLSPEYRPRPPAGGGS